MKRLQFIKYIYLSAFNRNVEVFLNIYSRPLTFNSFLTKMHLDLLLIFPFSSLNLQFQTKTLLVSFLIQKEVKIVFNC